MLLEEYYAAVRRLGLKPTRVPHVYETAYGDVVSVPDGEKQTPAQRRETIEFIKEILGI